MPRIRDEALVLKRVAFGEKDLIVHLLMQERGRRTAIARGAQKSAKRYAGGLWPFCHFNGGFTLTRRDPLYHLDDAQLISSHAELGEDLARYYLASYFFELLDIFLMEGETYAEVYELARHFLLRLKTCNPTQAHCLAFELKLLLLLGAAPELPDDTTDGLWFDTRREEWSERPLLGHEGLALSAPACALLRAIAACPLADLPRLVYQAKATQEALTLSRALLAAHAQRPIRSQAMVRELLG